MSAGFRERLVIDAPRGELRDGAIRYLTMRPDALMGMFDRLPVPARHQALTALAASVAEFGGRSLAAYKASAPGDMAALVQTVIATSAELGWGVWAMTPRDGGGFDVTVTNSPFAAGLAAPSDGPACAPILGILTALATHVIPGGVVVAETSCAAQCGGAECRFTLS